VFLLRRNIQCMADDLGREHSGGLLNHLVKVRLRPVQAFVPDRPNLPASARLRMSGDFYAAFPA
jgi:hypothetical protein